MNGSFGTGKTQLLAVATHCLIKQGMLNRQPVRILLCAHHQSSADHFINKYFGPLLEREQYQNNIDLVRILSRSTFVRNLRFKKYYVKSMVLRQNGHHYNQANYLIFVTTFLTSPSLLNTFQSGFFTHILLDEGSQSREPEAIAPLCLAGPDTKLVIAGDSRQVSQITL